MASKKCFGYLFITINIYCLIAIINSINCDNNNIKDKSSTGRRSQLKQSGDSSGSPNDNKHDETDQYHHQQQQQTATSHDPADPIYIKNELKDLIRMEIDKDSNGLVSEEEMRLWLGELHSRTLDHDVDRQWKIYNPQEHEVFSWEGYMPETQQVLIWDYYFNSTYPELVDIKENRTVVMEGDSDHIKQLKLMASRAEIRWKLADDSADTLLTKSEFKYLLHPDEGNEELQQLFINEATEDMDIDKNKQISLDEFMKHIQVLATDEEKADKSWLSSQQENFGQYLDKDKNGVLDKEEIKNWLVPSKKDKFSLEAARMIEIGDQNDDQHLSAFEIVDRYEQYVSLLPPEYWYRQTDESDNDDDNRISSNNKDVPPMLVPAKSETKDPVKDEL